MEHLKVVHLVILAFLTRDERGKNADFIDMQVQQLNRNPPHVERGRAKCKGQKVLIFC